MSQADFGDFNIASSPCKYACFWPDNRDCEIPASVLRLVASRHRDIRGQPVARMQYSVLRTASQELPMFGVFFYECKNCYDERLLLGIGPDTIFECNAKDREVRHQWVIHEYQIFAYMFSHRKCFTADDVSYHHEIWSERCAKKIEN